MLRKLVLLTVLGFIAITSYAADLVNINTANLSQLTDLKGVGKSKAQAIIDYREKNGPFPSAAALIKVKGVGKLILESNRNRMTVK